MEVNLLAIDSSGLVASVAVLSGGIIMAEYTVNYKKTHSQTLLPMIEEIKRMTELDLGCLDAIAISSGPGSFTGLRIGAATAKGLGLALNIPLVAVPTLEGLAYNLCHTGALVCPLMDARRNQVYTGVYSFEGGVFNTVKNQCATDIEDIITFLNAEGRKVIFLGDGVPVYRDVITEKTKTEYEFAPPHLAYQRAGALCKRAEELYEKNMTISPREFAPEYLRLSQAERERMEREKNA